MSETPDPLTYSGTCARYFGSDGTLCATHNGRFPAGGNVLMRCDRALKAETPEPTALDVDVLAAALEAVSPTLAPSWRWHTPDGTASGNHKQFAAALLATVRSTTPPEPEDGGT